MFVTTVGIKIPQNRIFAQLDAESIFCGHALSISFPFIVINYTNTLFVSTLVSTWLGCLETLTSYDEQLQLLAYMILSNIQHGDDVLLVLSFKSNPLVDLRSIISAEKVIL